MADPAPPAPVPVKTAAPTAAPNKTIGTDPAPAKKVDETNEDMVEVKQLKPYLGAEDKREPDGKPYMVTRRRAAELRAGGLVEYTNSADHDREVDDAIKKAGEATRKKYEVKK